MGQYFDQCCLPECFQKVFAKAHCLFQYQQEPRQFPLLCSSNRFLCRQHDLTWLFQRSIHGYIWTSCIYFSVFLFFKLIIDVVVMVIRPLEITKKTGPSLGFGKTLLSASYSIFLMSVLTSMYDPRAPPLAAVEEERRILCNEEELNDIRDDTKKKEEHIYQVMSPAQFNQAVTTNFPCLNLSLIFWAQLHSIFPPCDDCLLVLSDPEDFRPLMPSGLDLPTNSVVTFLSPLLRKYPLTQLCLTSRLLYPCCRLVSLRL